MVGPDGQREPFRFIACEAKDDGAAFGFDVHHMLKRHMPERYWSFSSNIARSPARACNGTVDRPATRRTGCSDRRRAQCTADERASDHG
jgi:hypothetical protein